MKRRQSSLTRTRKPRFSAHCGKEAAAPDASALVRVWPRPFGLTAILDCSHGAYYSTNGVWRCYWCDEQQLELPRWQVYWNRR
jgi:hypothetical protein